MLSEVKAPPEMAISFLSRERRIVWLMVSKMELKSIKLYNQVKSFFSGHWPSLISTDFYQYLVSLLCSPTYFSTGAHNKLESNHISCIWMGLFPVPRTPPVMSSHRLDISLEPSSPQGQGRGEIQCFFFQVM